jgi:hypothetical protein
MWSTSIPQSCFAVFLNQDRGLEHLGKLFSRQIKKWSLGGLTGYAGLAGDLFRVARFSRRDTPRTGITNVPGNA